MPGYEFPKFSEGAVKAVRGMIHLDFDSEGRLPGIEVLDADHFQAKELLEQAELIG